MPLILRLVPFGFGSHEQQAEQTLYNEAKGRPGGVRPQIDLVWRNAKFNRRPHVWSNTWNVPRDGVLELDYVALAPLDSSVLPDSIQDSDLQVWIPIHTGPAQNQHLYHRRRFS